MAFASESSPGIFATTHWSMVLAAGDGASPDAAAALEKLCRAYWYPLYAYVRRLGHSPEDSQDLTQAFFQRLLERNYLAQVRRERGRFRSFLLGALKHFLADEWKHAQRQKRGGGSQFVPLDAQSAEDRYHLEPADRLDAETIYQRRWALTLLDQALRRLESELAAAGRGDVFARLERFLVGERGHGTYAEAARDLGTSEASVKMTVSRLRQRCRELIREEIAQTVSTAVEVDEEYRALVAALAQG